MNTPTTTTTPISPTWPILPLLLKCNTNPNLNPSMEVNLLLLLWVLLLLLQLLLLTPDQGQCQSNKVAPYNKLNNLNLDNQDVLDVIETGGEERANGFTNIPGVPVPQPWPEDQVLTQADPSQQSPTSQSQYESSLEIGGALNTGWVGRCPKQGRSRMYG